MEISSIRRHQGFTMVELMVGLVLGLLASLAIFTAISSFESQRRITAGGAEMQQNGLLALYFLEQDLRMAGFGLIDSSTVPGSLPCVSVNGTSIAPVRIEDGGTVSGVSASDTIITHRLDADTGGIVTGGNAAKLTSLISTPITSITVDTAKAIHLNDYLLVSDANRNCTQVQATSLPTEQPAVIAPVSTIINLGQDAPSFPDLQYRLDANFNLLHSEDGGTTELSVATNIVNLQAQYGIANSGSQSVSCWTDATGNACGGTDWASPSATEINRIKAIRVAIVARSAQRSPKQVTTAPLSWYGGAIDLSDLANWQNYRYKVYQTVIPVRNVIWGNL